MAEYPPLDEWEFPRWLVCFCKDTSRFYDARDLLVNELGFVYSPYEDEYLGRAIVLPRPDISLDDHFKDASPTTGEWKGWGIGRIRFAPPEIRGQAAFDIKYLLECPWEYIKTNPMKNAIIELYNLLHPNRFLNHNGKEIPFPYPVELATD